MHCPGYNRIPSNGLIGGDVFLCQTASLNNIRKLAISVGARRAVPIGRGMAINIRQNLGTGERRGTARRAPTPTCGARIRAAGIPLYPGRATAAIPTWPMPLLALSAWLHRARSMKGCRNSRSFVKAKWQAA